MRTDEEIVPQFRRAVDRLDSRYKDFEKALGALIDRVVWLEGQVAAVARGRPVVAATDPVTSNRRY